MEHKGVEYTVVRTANPTGWAWTVLIRGKRAKTGMANSRPMAIALACAAIEKAIKVRPPKPIPKQ
jgi:hypothetical protein